MLERRKGIQRAAVDQKAALCLKCRYKIRFSTDIPQQGVLRVKPENISVKVTCFVAGEEVKPCHTTTQRDHRISHFKNKPVFQV